MTERYFGFPALVLEPGVRTGMPILYDNPKEVGADRIANAVGRTTSTAARRSSSTSARPRRSRRSAPTANISAARSSPASRSRWTRCSGARGRPAPGRAPAAKHVIGKSTSESIQSGTIYGFSAQVDGLVDRFVAELGECTVISTGGLADLISPHARTVQHYEPWLTLYGLRIIFERNA